VTGAEIVYWGVLICLTYLICVYSAFVLLLIPSAIEAFYLNRQERNEDFDAIADSPFTIPVSIIVPAFNEEVMIRATVSSLLRLNYPQYEVIVVNDGSNDGTIAKLRAQFDLEPCEFFMRKVFKTGRVRNKFRSRSHGSLIVLDKENGGKADALNCGINAARYRYICTVDADTVFYPNALARAMRLVLRDPARIIGVTSNITISRKPEETALAAETPLTAFQLLDYLRAFLINRLGWSRLHFMLCSVGAFAVWRRDVAVELGGFSGKFTCEDIEFTFRAHEHFLRNKRSYKILALSESVGRTEGPDTIGRLVSQRARWQRVISETLWHYRHMMLNPRYGTVGLLGLPFYVIVEVAAPVFQALALILIPLALWIGVPVRDLLMTLLAITLANGVLNNAALFLNDIEARSYRKRDLMLLILLGPLDLFTYRLVLFYAQMKGLIGFLRGDKSWHKFKRNIRPDQAR
jgi:biofilm PGA synthesis N-glycosyltransferase PgaC